MGCIVSSVACCFCSSAASLCCSCLPACKGSTSTRIMYSLFLIISIILSAIVLTPSIMEKLKNVPALCSPLKINNITVSKMNAIDCEAITGFGAVYRICFATTIVYFIHCLLTIGVKSSNDIRAKIHNGFWFFKFLIWFAILIGSFFIPNHGFIQTWMVFGMIGGFIYLLIQLVLIVDLAHSWNEKWMQMYENEEGKIYQVGLLGFTLFFYILSIIATVLFYVYYGSADECSLNKAFISINMLLCLALSIISILPWVREHLPLSGLLQSSIITLYILFLTWCALSNGKNPVCNPSFFPGQNGTIPSKDHEPYIHSDWQTVIGVIVLALSVLYSTMKSSSHSGATKFMYNNERSAVYMNNDASKSDNKDAPGQVVYDDESESVAYNYSLYHLFLTLATLYVMVMLTNWLQLGSDLKSLVRNEASMWVRIVSSWVCALIYGLTMILPNICTDRQF